MANRFMYVCFGTPALVVAFHLRARARPGGSDSTSGTRRWEQLFAKRYSLIGG
jgi:hypothetical protein